MKVMSQVKIFILTFIFLLRKTYSFEVDYKFDEKVDERIIGGVDAKIVDFPHHVVIEEHSQILLIPYWRYHCGGSIISSIHILTAAHCVERENRIITGVEKQPWTYVYDTKDIYYVEKIYRHEEFFVENIGLNDIGIIRLKRHITYSEKVSSGLIYTKKQLVENDTNFPGYFISIGYGQTQTIWNDYFYYTLKKAKLVSEFKYHYFNHSTPPYHSLIVNIITKPMVENLESGRSFFGDSGGSLIVQLNNKNYLVGICSRGDIDGEFIIFTRITYYFEWIYNQIGLRFSN